MRKTSGLLLASGMIAAVSLTGCTPAASCTPEWPAGGLAEAVTVTGPFADVVDVSFPTPLVQKDTTTTAVAIEGDGPVVQEGQFARVRISIVDGATAQSLDAGIAITMTDGPEPRLSAAAQCMTVGSRVVAVGPASELIGADYIAANNLAFQPDQTLVYIVDVLDSYLGRADGTDRLPQNGLPTVSLAPDGRPGLTFTNSPAPADLRVSVLKEGSGAAVEAGDTVVLRYTVANWTTRKVISTSWDLLSPSLVEMTEGAPMNSQGTIAMSPGFVQGLVGQTVGSQVLVSVPVDLGGAGASDPVIAVFDILGIQGDG